MSRIANSVLVLCSLAAGLILCEIGYRIYLVFLLHARYQAAPVGSKATFHAINNPPWRYDRIAGYDFEPNTAYTFAVIKDGNFVVCSSRGAINARGELSSDLIPENPSVRIAIFGDSFTANAMGDVRDPRQWPSSMRASLEAALGRPVDVLNLGRDGYSVLQMFDLAADRIGRLQADLVVFAVIHPDFVRSRGWMVRRDDADFPRLFRVATSDIAEADRSRLIDTALINSSVTPEWCRRMTDAVAKGDAGLTRSDPVVQALNNQYAIIASERSTPVLVINLWDPRILYSWQKLQHGDPFHELAIFKPTSIYAPNSLNSFAQDPGFMTSLTRLRATGVPFVFLRIPTLPEIEAKKTSWLTSRDEILARSLAELTNRFLIETIPFIDAPPTPAVDQSVGGRAFDDPHPNANLHRLIGNAAAQALLSDINAAEILTRQRPR